MTNEQKENPARLENDWNFWKDIVLNADGTVNIEQLKKELSDFSFIIEEVPKVYMHITNGLLSKPNYYASGVIGKSDECYRDGFITSLKEFLDEMHQQKSLSKKSLKILLANIESYI